jgi:hypothetical protein
MYKKSNPISRILLKIFRSLPVTTQWTLRQILQYWGVDSSFPNQYTPGNDGKINIERVPIMVTDHCNNSCQFCSTKSVYLPQASYGADKFIPWLDKLINGNIEFSLIAITGGEPFLHENIGSLIDELKNHYPDKTIGVDTNFFWASEEGLSYYLPKLENLNLLRVTIYPHIVARLGGTEKVKQSIDLIKRSLPGLEIMALNKASHFIKWKLCEKRMKVRGPCGTSDCYVLISNGKIHRCTIATHLDRHPEYRHLKLNCSQSSFDLSGNTDGFIEWINRYPFDLCEHCTFWHGELTPWRGGVNTKDGKMYESMFWDRIRREQAMLLQNR